MNKFNSLAVNQRRFSLQNTRISKTIPAVQCSLFILESPVEIAMPLGTKQDEIEGNRRY